MHMKTMFIALATTSVLGLATTAVGAAPLVANKAAPDATASVERIDYRQCWRRNGERHCRMVREGGAGVYGYNGYSGYAARSQPENYRAGSTEWWRAMDREDRGGFGQR
jgi:hypothetical protein